MEVDEREVLEIALGEAWLLVAAELLVLDRLLLGVVDCDARIARMDGPVCVHVWQEGGK